METKYYLILFRDGSMMTMTAPPKPTKNNYQAGAKLFKVGPDVRFWALSEWAGKGFKSMGAIQEQEW